MFTVIENVEIYDPEPLGKTSLLIAEEKISRIGDIEADTLRGLVDVEVIDGKGCILTPGLIDPHQHLLGGSGEDGFSTQTPEISATEIVEAGITTVVGCLGADSTMKTMAGLLAKAKALKEEGLNAYVWSGGYSTPPTTITDSIGNDIMFIDEIVGMGEIAISDERSSKPSAHELARLAHTTHKAGMLSKKAGLTHFHIGDGEERLGLIRELIEKHDTPAEWLYPTHIGRTDKLMLEAIELAKNGSFVDIDTVDEDLPDRLKFYIDNSGWTEKLTASSDASITSPENLFNSVRKCILEHNFPIPLALSLVTRNPSEALKLSHKGSVTVGKVADLLMMKRDDLELVEVISRGRRLMKNGRINFKEAFLKESNRQVSLVGERSNGRTKPLAEYRSPDQGGQGESAGRTMSFAPTDQPRLGMCETGTDRPHDKPTSYRFD